MSGRYNSAEIRSLNDYKNQLYGEINNTLRKNYITSKTLSNDNMEEMPILKHIDNIDKGIKRQGSKKEIVLYRGITPNAISFVSNSFKERGFSSTSKGESVPANNFTDNNCCVLKFIKPESIYGYHYSGNNGKKDIEEEVLLERNIEYINIKEVGFIIGDNNRQIKLFTCNIQKFELPTQTEIKRFKTEKNKMHELDVDNYLSKIKVLLKDLKKYRKKDESDIRKIFDINQDFELDPDTISFY